MAESKQCSHETDGPKIGYRVVAWRKRCRKRTTHESGRCYVHRDPTWYVGKTKADAEAEAAERAAR